MRVGILICLEPAEPNVPGEHLGALHMLLRGHLRVAASSVAQHQLGLLLALQCQKILCVSPNMTPEFAAMQNLAERTGARFHLVTGPVGLLPLVTAQDEVFLVQDGVLMSPEIALAMFEDGPGVFTLPAEVGIPAGFERLDINHASAGALRFGGTVVQALSQMAPDCGLGSALTRLALQHGVPLRSMPPGVLEQGMVRIITNPAEATAVEQLWLANSATDDHPGPVDRAARWLAKAFGPAILGFTHANAAQKGAIALLSFGALLTGGWLKHTAPALMMLALAWVIWRLGGLLHKLSRPVLPTHSDTDWQEPAAALLFDSGLVTLCTIAGTGSLLDSLFAPLMLVLGLRLVALVAPGSWRRLLEDRASLALLLAAAAAFTGLLLPAIQLLVLGAGFTALIHAGIGRERITRA